MRADKRETRLYMCPSATRETRLSAASWFIDLTYLAATYLHASPSLPETRFCPPTLSRFANLPSPTERCRIKRPCRNFLFHPSFLSVAYTEISWPCVNVGNIGTVEIRARDFSLIHLRRRARDSNRGFRSTHLPSKYIPLL